jgi:hypothetical protein
MTAKDSAKKRIKRDAEIFLSRLRDVELVLGALTPASTLDESYARLVSEKLDEIECLKFASWSTALAPEELGTELSEAGVPPDSMEGIKAFADKYRSYAGFLKRLFRGQQGYENELTRMKIRPAIYPYVDDAVIIMNFYSWDRLVLTSNNGLDGLVSLIDMLIDSANDTVDSINSMSPELLSAALDADTVSSMLERVETFKRLTSANAEEKPSQS